MKNRSQLIHLTKKAIYQTPLNEKLLSKLEYGLYCILRETPEDVPVNNILAKLYFEKGNYKKSLIHFTIAQKYDNENIVSLYGLYKSYVMLEQYTQAALCFKKYASLSEKAESSFIMSIFENLLNNTFTPVENKNQFLTNVIKDDKLSELYSELIDAYNEKNYLKCIRLSEQCELIAKNQNILMEFQVVKKLFTKLSQIKKADIEQKEATYYNELDLLIEQNDLEKIIHILKELPKTNIKDEGKFYRALRFIIKKGYLNEAEQIISSTRITKKNELIIKTLIREMNIINQFQNYSEEKKKMLEDSMSFGKEYIAEGDYESAYDIYTAAYYVTEYPTLLFYIGKVFYFSGRIKDAEEYFKEFIKVGGVKTAKAYTYLRNINKQTGKIKKMSYYTKQANELNKIFYPEYNIIYDHTEENLDKLKMWAQSKPEEYNGIFEEPQILSKKIDQ